MRAFLLQFLILAVFSTLPTKAERAGGGGDSVNNGGGLSEQALVFSARSYRSFAESCLKVPACGAREPARTRLRALLSCALPSDATLRFGSLADSPELGNGTPSGKPYAETAEKNLLVNRSQIYSLQNEPLRIPGALAYLSRIYLDLCQVLPFAQSAAFAGLLADFANFDGEQVTVGKDDLNLPSAQWIRIRTLYSDLIVEAPLSIHRLSCPKGRLELCSLMESNEAPSGSRFRNLSLVRESKSGAVVSFLVEGTFLGQGSEIFQLEADFREGKLLALRINGRSLSLPQEE